MGIAGSIVDQSFWENYLGIRVQAVDMTEVRRRMDQKLSLIHIFCWLTPVPQCQVLPWSLE